MKSICKIQMEEVEDEQVYSEGDAQDADIDVPPPPPLVRQGAGKMKEKVQCEGCSRWMSRHTHRYQHKCKAQTVDEAAAPPPTLRVRLGNY